MGYFSELPNLQYQSPFSDRLSDSSYVFAKNIFRRMKVRDDLQNVLTVFNKYQIVDGTRPDTVAEELYGESEYDYVVLVTANITNVRDQWPITNKELYEYVVQKYGLENINNVNHYVLTSDKTVRTTFDSAKLSSGDITAVTNLEYERDYNEKKRKIKLLKPSIVRDFANQFRGMIRE